jgi:dolichyl-phosphate beta-glucosyltransferase
MMKIFRVSLRTPSDYLPLLIKRAFDTELVVIAEKLDVSLAEVGVIWHEIEGSKLDVDKITLALVSLGMLRDMVCVRACYLLGIWKLKR